MAFADFSVNSSYYLRLASQYFEIVKYKDPSWQSATRHMNSVATYWEVTKQDRQVSAMLITPYLMARLEVGLSPGLRVWECFQNR